jgi:hypothetical protein
LRLIQQAQGSSIAVFTPLAKRIIKPEVGAGSLAAWQPIKMIAFAIVVLVLVSLRLAPVAATGEFATRASCANRADQVNTEWRAEQVSAEWRADPFSRLIDEL